MTDPTAAAAPQADPQAGPAAPAPPVERDRSGWWPLALTVLVVGAALGPLLVGFEPIGGDPDRFYRPIKQELARALAQGRLPFWSDRFGVGAPLLAESHAAAFYPPNQILYRLLDPFRAYRLAMWAHYVAVAIFTFAYASVLGLTAWGAALAAVAFSLCGFQAIHSSHEWAYQGLAFLPLVLLLVERYCTRGGAGWLAGIALAWAAQCSLGHFQLAFWTALLAAWIGTWRIVAGRLGLVRWLGLGLALGVGALLAAVQLGPTWELARFVARDRRPFAYLAYHTLPPAHLAEAAAPRLVREPTGDPEGGYWAAQGTSGYEAAFYVGTAPLALALIALVGGRVRGALRVWVPILGLSLALATMAQWWPAGYAGVLALPGFGLFRCPARYTAIASLALTLMAGAGLDRSLARGRFRVGLAVACLVGLAMVAWLIHWLTIGAPFGRVSLERLLGPLSWTALAWATALVAIGLARNPRLVGLPVLVAAVELTALYYQSTTEWGWPVRLPERSPALTRLAAEPAVGLVAGPVENLPVLAGLDTGTPYLGLPLPAPNAFLLRAQGRPTDDPGRPLNRFQATHWLQRLGVTHALWPGPGPFESVTPVWSGADAGLDRLAYHAPGEPLPRRWSLYRLPAPFPVARAATQAVLAPDLNSLLERLGTAGSPETVFYLAGDVPQGSASPRARVARVESWDGTTARVQHDGTCDLIVRRAWYPGWTASINGGPVRPVGRADGGLQAVRLDGAGPSQVTFRYEPTGWPWLRALSLTTLAGLLAMLGVAGVRARSRASVGG